MTTIYFDKVVAETIQVECRSTSSKRLFSSISNNPLAKKVMAGMTFKPRKDNYIGKCASEQSSLMVSSENNGNLSFYRKEFAQFSGFDLIKEGILKHILRVRSPCTFQLPDYSRLVTDCSKMQVLQDLMKKLHAGGHRCLIFCQMTRMMDILEDFLIWQKYSYFRMDGQTQLQDRKFMTEEFQTNPNIFCFILSTRAGGLGINLIAADTVIFYDNDWNPTMDSQATDRAHRIG